MTPAEPTYGHRGKCPFHPDRDAPCDECGTGHDPLANVAVGGTRSEMSDLTARLPPFSCHCEGVGVGTHDNDVSMRTPEGKWIAVDTCLATIIGWLWHQGVRTIASCCGHGGVVDPVVTVEIAGEWVDILVPEVTDE